MPRATPGDTPRRDLPALRDEPLQSPDVLVVDQAQLVHAELADLAASEPTSLDGLAGWRNGYSSFWLVTVVRASFEALERDLVIGFAVDLDRLRRRRRSRSLRPPHELHPLCYHFDHGSLLAVFGFPVARL